MDTKEKQTPLFHGSVDRLSLGKIPEILNKIIPELNEEEAGGTVIFLGHVKGRVNGKQVKKLVYEAYEPYTSKVLNKIAQDQKRDPQVKTTIILHNNGELKPGDPTVLIIVTATRREKAFEKAREVLERVKKEPPIFKLEVREDGEYWIIGDGERLRRKPIPGS